MRPRIGIPLCLDAAGRIRPGRRTHYGDTAFARAVTDAGGLALQLPIQHPDEVADAIDGLLIPGGDDLLPPRPYPASIDFEETPPEQLAFDRALLARALERGLPVLGICYGMQLLALQAGGSLHYHIPHDLPGAGEHRLAADATHRVRVEAGSRLAALLGAGDHEVNSRHHQAVADAGALRVSARAADGVIEAVEGTGTGFAIGVQWHAEGMGAAQQPLFSAFVAACAG